MMKKKGFMGPGMLIIIILTIAAVAIVLLFSVKIFGIPSVSADSTKCATNVRTAISSAQLGNTIELDKCDTTYRLIDSKVSDKEFIKQINEDHTNCLAGFAPAINKGEKGSLIQGENNLCYVCALYSFDNPRTVNIADMPRSDDQRLNVAINAQQISVDELTFSEPTAVLFFQTKDFESLIEELKDNPRTVGYATGGVAGATTAGLLALTVASGGTALVVGGVVGAVVGISGYVYSVWNQPNSDITSVTIITPYNQKITNDLGCTALSPTNT